MKKRIKNINLMSSILFPFDSSNTNEPPTTRASSMYLVTCFTGHELFCFPVLELRFASAKLS